jgi:NADH-quinone oxidoreductase subunit L
MFVFALIPFLPLLAFLIIAFGGRWLRGQAHRIGIPAIVLSFGLSVLAFLEILQRGPFNLPLYKLIHVGRLQIDLGLYVDQLTVLLLLLVTGVSSLVHIFSSRYMHGDPRYERFFAVIALFTFSMLMLVMSTNLLMLFIFWEVMGICSYLLISHWSERKSACNAATKAFLVNAVSGVGLSFGVILTFATFQTLDIQTILHEAPKMADSTINVLQWVGLEWNIHILTLIALFLFVGAIGKSSQVPLHVWLPYAMEAPTPVSALIHAATMVNAGVFLVARLSPLVMQSSVAMTVIAVVGGTTALFGAAISLAQTDIKKILAYSTMSQIGFMIMTCGLGAFVAAIFHLLAHGALKAFLFLSTGNALQNVFGAQHFEAGKDRHHPALNHNWSLYLGALILAVIPPFVIFSGPYERLWTAVSPTSGHLAFWVIGLITVFFTAVYLFHSIVTLFSGTMPIEWQDTGTSAGSSEGTARLFSPSLLVALLGTVFVLASLLLGLWKWFVGFLAPAFPSPQLELVADPGGSVVSTWILLPLFTAFFGWAMAYYLHFSHSKPGPAFQDKLKTLYVWCLNKGYVDEIYDAYIVRPNLKFSHWLWQVVDIGGIDRSVNGLATISVNAAQWLWQVIDIRGIDRAINGIARFSIVTARWLWQVIDIRGIDRTVTGLGGQSLSLAKWFWQIIDIRTIQQSVDRVGEQAEATGQALQHVEPRMLQHHLLVLIFWLIVAITLLFWLVY